MTLWFPGWQFKLGFLALTATKQFYGQSTSLAASAASKVELLTCSLFAHHSLFPDFCLGPSYLCLSKIRSFSHINNHLMSVDVTETES